MVIDIFRCATIVEHVLAMWALRVLAVRHLLQDQEVSSIVCLSVSVHISLFYTCISPVIYIESIRTRVLNYMGGSVSIIIMHNSLFRSAAMFT